MMDGVDGSASLDAGASDAWLGQASDGGTTGAVDFAALLDEAFAGAPGQKGPPSASGAHPAGPVLFGREPGEAGEISPNDIHQNQVNDCWLDATMGEMAKQDPGAIRSMIHDNGNGTYTVHLHALDNGLHNAWGLFGNRYRDQEVTVTPDVPHRAINQQSPDPVSVGGRHEIWPQVIERAVARQRGGYDAINSGQWPSVAMQALTGHDAKEVSASDYSFVRMRADLKAGKLVVLSTQSQADLGAQPNSFGLVGPHAYMVVGAVLDAHGHQVALLQNPWGNEPVHAVPYTSATQPLFTYASVGTTH